MATRPVRHWAGKAPEGYKATSSDSDSDVEESPAVAVRAQEAKRVVESQDVQHGAKHYDRRLARISQAEDTGPLRNNRKTETTPSTRNSHRPSEEEETDVQRRNRIRALALRRQQEEEEEQQHIKAQEDEEDGSTEEEESEEEEEESEEDEEDTRVMLKPVFVSKSKRDTVKDRAAKEAEEKALVEKQAGLDAERRKLAHNMVAEEIKRAAAAVEAEMEEAFNVDDADGINEEEEQQAWVLRELGRIKRDRLEKEERDLEAQDKERRAAMTDSELEAEKLAREAMAEKKTVKFMQRYYHKGAFYTDDARISEALETRDFLQPTLEDRFNKEALPSVMQVKDFGKAGRTKYTHLKDQDTSQMDAGWNQNSAVTQKILGRLGGFKSGSSTVQPKPKKQKT